MHHRGRLIVVAIIAVIIIVGAYGVMHVSLSALPQPGPLETAIASEAKDWYIGRAARSSVPPPPKTVAPGIATGEEAFGMDCANCHGQDGRKPTPIGQAKYPRVLDLGSPEVQEMSDAELFWVIKNGIRLSGMPGFAHIESDDEIWQLTFYVRSLGRQPKH